MNVTNKQLKQITTTSEQLIDVMARYRDSKIDGRQVIADMIKAHGGGRTVDFIQNVHYALHIVYPKTKAELSEYMGKPNIKFPDKGVGYDCWRDLILPHLPKIKPATTGKTKKNRTVDLDKLAEREAKRLVAKYGVNFVHRLAALLSK